MLSLIKQFISMFPLPRSNVWAENATGYETYESQVATSTLGQGIKDTVFAMIPNLILSAIFLVVVSLASGAVVGSQDAMLGAGIAGLGLVGGLFLLLISPLIGIVLMLLLSGMEFLVAKVLGGTGTFGQHVGLLASISAGISIMFLPISILDQIIRLVGIVFPPFKLLGCITGIVALAVGLWTLYLQAKALTFVHKISTVRAVVAILTPVVVFIILAIVLVLLLTAVFVASSAPLLDGATY